MNNLFQDLRYGVRMLAKKPGFTAVAVITLMLGIGANTAIFTVVNAVLLRPLPYTEPDRLAAVWTNRRFSQGEFVRLKEEAKSFTQLGVIDFDSFSLTGEGDPLRVTGLAVSSESLPIFNAGVSRGRMFSEEEFQLGQNQAVILSHGLWQRRFGSDPNILGKQITIDGFGHAVVGIMRADFRLPQGESELWVPIAFDASNNLAYFGLHQLTVVGRIREGATMAQAQTDVKAFAHRFAQENPRFYSLEFGQDAVVRTLQEEVVGDVRPSLLVLLGAVGMVLLIACINVANLLLARGVERKREIAIRLALGAGRGRIIRQLLAESVLLSLLSGGMALLLAAWVSDLMVKMVPTEIPVTSHIGIDGSVLGFSLGLALLTGIIFGLAPAIQLSRLELQFALKDSSWTSTGGSGPRLRNLLVISEVALSMVLLIGASLLIKSLWRLQQVDPGFNTDRTLTFRLDPPGSQYRGLERRRAYYTELLDRLRAVPGVESVGAIQALPLSGRSTSENIVTEDRPVRLAESPEAENRTISHDYFRAMGIPLLQGREFSGSDHDRSPGVAIISESLALELWPGEDPLGKRFRSFADEEVDWLTVVGVVGDVKHRGLRASADPTFYRPHTQVSMLSSYLVIRSAVDPVSLADALRNRVWSLDRNVPVSAISTYESLITQSLSEPRFTALLLGLFAALALALGTIGIYGVIAYSVSQRTREIGLRLALGAQRSDILRLVVKGGLTLTLIGVGIGLISAFALTRLMSGLLYEVSATDPLTFVVIALLLTCVAVMACWIPARRATRVDPMVALRYE